MQAKPKEIKAAISTSTRNPRSLLHYYQINIKRKVKRMVLIGRVMQQHQDQPLGANPRIGIGKKRILMQRVYILIFYHQCQCRGCLPMLMQIDIHHGKGMIQWHILHHILDHLTIIMQLQEDQRSVSYHMFKTISIRNNRSGAQERRKR